jgi:hypothetical protein
MLPTAMKKATLGLCLLLVAVPLACQKEGPSVDSLAQEAKEKEARLKKEKEDAEAKEQKSLERAVAILSERRKPLDQLFADLWDKLPPDPKKLKREPCPDAKIVADTPDPEKRKVLVFNQEILWRMAGKGDLLPDGAVAPFHTPAGDEAQYLRRSEGKETPLADRAPPRTSVEADRRIEAIEFVKSHRYLGVAMFTSFRPSVPQGTAATPAHAEGFTVIFDRETKTALCQVDASADNLVPRDEALVPGIALYESLWTMYLHATAKNLDSVSKELSIEGVPRKKH